MVLGVQKDLRFNEEKFLCFYVLHVIILIRNKK